MKKWNKPIAVVLLTYMGVAALHAQPQATRQLDNYMKQSLRDAVEKNGIFGAACAVRLPGGSTWSGFAGKYDTTGVASYAQNEQFQTASITKMFVATVVIQLVAEGVLSLEDPLSRFLPDYEHVDNSITVRQLLRHRTGLVDYLTISPRATNYFFQNPDSLVSPEFILTNYLQAPQFARNERFSYSNTNFLILGMIIEKLTGHPFHIELRNRILQPLKLTRTFMPPFESQPGNAMRSWTDWNRDGIPDDAAVMHNKGFSSTIFTAGGIVSCPEDLLRFCYELHSGRLLGAYTTLLYDFSDVSLSVSNTGYGLGVMRYSFHDKTYYGHAGDINGFTNLAIYSPANDVTIVVMINKDLQDRIGLCRDLLTAIEQLIAAKNNT